MFARKIRFAILVLLCLVLTASLCVSASAVTDPLEINVSLDPAAMDKPSNAKLTIKLTNTSGTETIDNLQLVDPDGKSVASFTVQRLTPGKSYTWEESISVNENQLDEGEVVYTLRYNRIGEDVTTQSRKVSAPVSFTGERVKLVINRVITPEVARGSTQVTISYELTNRGTVELTNLRVKDSAVSSSIKTVDSLPVGETKVVEYTVKMGTVNLTSKATVYYRTKGSTATLQEEVPAQVIELAKPNLSTELSCTTEKVNIGESAHVLLTFNNQGNVSYSNVSVKDDKLGEVFSGIDIPAGEVVVLEDDFVLKEKTTFKWTATLPNNTGETKTLNIDPLTVNVYDPEKELMLTLGLTFDKESISSQPADLRFTLTVTNNSNIKAEKIGIYHKDLYIGQIDALEPGATATILRDVQVPQAGKFQFTAKVTDSMSNEVTFNSNIVKLDFVAPTARPTSIPAPTYPPLASVTAAPAEPILQTVRTVFKDAGMLLALLFAFLLVILIISTITRAISKKKSNAAFDHFDPSTPRDYTYTGSADEDQLPASELEASAADMLPHERILKAAKTEEALEQAAEQLSETAEPEAEPASEDEGGYRLSRDSDQQSASAVLFRDELAADAQQPHAYEEIPAAAAVSPRRRSAAHVHRTSDDEE